MLGKNCARALPILAVAEASCASWRRMSGRCVSSSDGSPGVTRGDAMAFSEPPMIAHAFRRPRHQRRQRIDVQRQGLAQRRHGGALIGKHGFLLRDIEVGSGAGLQPLLDGVEDARSAGDVLLGGTQPVLRRQHLEIGIGNADQRRQRHHVAVEPGGDCGFLRSLCGIAVLAPEIEFVAALNEAW